jgi:acetyl esterase/lipase
MKRLAIGCLTILGVLVVLGIALVVFIRSHTAFVVQRDLVYSKADGIEVMLNLAMPRNGRGPFPAIVYLHGGGWRHGDRQELEHLAEGSARFRHVGVTVGYRLSDKAKFPAQIEDCKAAIRWLRANATAYKIDPDRIAVVGFSAGGHLGCLLGVLGNDRTFDVGENLSQSSRVQAVISFAGPTDFTTNDWSPWLTKEALVPLFGGTLAEKPDVYKNASPIAHVAAGAPPFLLVHGTADELVPVDQAHRFAKKLQSAGVPVREVIYEGEGHGLKPDALKKALIESVKFLRERKN